MLPALIKFVAKVPRLGVCGFIQYYSFKRPSRGEAQRRGKKRQIHCDAEVDICDPKHLILFVHNSVGSAHHLCGYWSLILIDVFHRKICIRRLKKKVSGASSYYANKAMKCAVCCEISKVAFEFIYVALYENIGLSNFCKT